jgi:hypothetical protein
VPRDMTPSEIAHILATIKGDWNTVVNGTDLCALFPEHEGVEVIWRKKKTGVGDDPLVFTLQDMHDGALVIAVYHETDGDWQYLTTMDPDPADARLIHQSHVYRIDPSLRPLHAMPKGTWAVRSEADEAWTFGPHQE